MSRWNISEWARRVRASAVPVMRRGPANRVIFYYHGEEGTYVENVYVTLFRNGVVHITSQFEDTHTHIQNCEIIWRLETTKKADKKDGLAKVRLLKPKLDPDVHRET